MKLFNAFLNDESGAVTVDWVVLTAAIVGLGIAVLTSVGNGTTTHLGRKAESVESGHQSGCNRPKRAVDVGGGTRYRPTTGAAIY